LNENENSFVEEDEFCNPNDDESVDASPVLLIDATNLIDPEPNLASRDRQNIHSCL
jgi:hypothetical protein